MRIAVFLNQGELGGGGHQYEVMVSKILFQHSSTKYQFLFFSSDFETVKKLKSEKLPIYYYKEGLLGKIKSLLLKNIRLYNVLAKFNLSLTYTDKLLQFYKVDLVYFLSPNGLCSELTQHNYITTVWDLCHRDHVEFPEVYNNKQYENRELRYYRDFLPKAVAVFSDSELGKKNIVRRYGVDEHRVIVQPFFYIPATSTIADIDIRKKYNIAGDYLFYPAQFWPHKNHIYIIKALCLLKANFKVRLTAVFTGSDKNNLDYIKSVAKKLGVEDQIVFPGFVPTEEIPSFYKQALALVMPSYFGPTNIPPLEAFYYGCPVCYSDLEGFREQVGEAAFLIDLNNPESLVESILRIQSDPVLVNGKIEAGKKILRQKTLETFWERLKGVLDKYAVKRCCYFSSN